MSDVAQWSYQAVCLEARRIEAILVALDGLLMGLDTVPCEAAMISGELKERMAALASQVEKHQ